MDTVHSSDKPFKCEFCSHTSNRKDKIKVHVEHVHLKIQRPPKPPSKKSKKTAATTAAQTVPQQGPQGAGPASAPYFPLTGAEHFILSQ